MPAIAISMSLVIANAISISVHERRTEIALLKVLGFRPWQVTGLVVGEAVLVGASSGFLSSFTVYMIVQAVGGVNFPVIFFTTFYIPFGAVWRGVMLGSGTAFIGSFFPAWSAARVKITQVFSKVSSSAMGAPITCLSSCCMTEKLRLIGKLIVILAALVPLVFVSLLPLSALILAIPIAVPQENPLGQLTPRNCSWLHTAGKRLFSLFSSVALVIALAAVVNEFLTWLPLPERTYYGELAAEILPVWLVQWAPPALVHHWPSALICIYVVDLLLLIALGSVPVKYNLRNLRVRWKNSLLVVLAFAVVVALLVVMLSLVNAMYRLIERSGHPANVIVMSEGATDEFFSNLGGGDVSNGQFEVVTLDELDQPLKTPVVVKHFDRKGEKIRVYSRETYLVASQPIPGSPPAPRVAIRASARGGGPRCGRPGARNGTA